MSETPHTTLGERGRGRALTAVTEDGAELLIRTVLDLDDRGGRGDGRLRIVEEVRERRVPRPAALLRINTAALGSYHEGRDGHVWALGGAFALAEGHFASGAAGRCGTAPDVLIGFRAGEPGAVVALGYGHMRAVAWAWDGSTVRECRELADVPAEARPVLAAAVARLYRRGLYCFQGAAVTTDGRRVAVTGATPLSQEREWERAGHIWWGVVVREGDGALRFLEGDEAIQDADGAEAALGSGRHGWCGWVPGIRTTDGDEASPAPASWWEAVLASTPTEAVSTASGVEVEVAVAPRDKRDRRMFSAPVTATVAVGGETVGVTLTPADGGAASAYEWADAGVSATAPGWVAEVLEAAVYTAASGYAGLRVRLRLRPGSEPAMADAPAEEAGDVPAELPAHDEDLGWDLQDLPEAAPAPALAPAQDAAAALAAAWGARRR